MPSPGGNNRRQAVPDIRYSAQTKGLYLQHAREARFLFSSLGLPFLRKKGLAKDLKKDPTFSAIVPRERNSFFVCLSVFQKGEEGTKIRFLSVKSHLDAGMKSKVE